MKKYYIYFFDRASIAPCDNEEDCLNKIAKIRRDHPDRTWSLIEIENNGEYRIVTGSHMREPKIEVTIFVISFLLFIAVCFIFAAYVYGIF